VGLRAATAGEVKARIEAERSNGAFLLYRDGSGVQQILELDAGRTDRLTIGRRSTCDVCLRWDAQVSRVHAEIERASAEWMIDDDGLSRNGTFVNDRRLVGRRLLVHGDVIRVGKTAIAFYNSGESVSADATEVDGGIAVGEITAAQRRVLVALCRPIAVAGTFTAPASNQQIAEELHVSVDAVKAQLRALFARFGVENLPQNRKRARLVELAFASGAISEHEL